MGWGSGSELYDKVILILLEAIPDFKARKVVHKKMIDAFWDNDWDTQGDCEGKDTAFDQAWEELQKEQEDGSDTDTDTDTGVGIYVLLCNERQLAVHQGTKESALAALKNVKLDEWVEDMKPDGAYREGCSLEKYEMENEFYICGPLKYGLA